MSMEAVSEFPELTLQKEIFAKKASEQIQKERARKQLLLRWWSELDTKGAGMIKGKEYWLQKDFATWDTCPMPGYIDEQLYRNYDGTFWLAKVFELNEADIKSNWTLVCKSIDDLVCKSIDDMDRTYLNGIQIGSSDSVDQSRSYTIPSKALKKGKNVLVIRAFDHGGNGGISSNILELRSAKGQIALNGKWYVRKGVSVTELKDYFPPQLEL